MIRKILYIGNDLAKKSKYNSSMETLSNAFELEGYSVYKSSNKINKIVRLLDMCFNLIKHKNVNYIIIDTYSTHNFYFALLTSQLARLFNIKYIPILHGGNLPSRISKSIKFSNLIFKNSYKNVAPSNYLKYEFEKRGYKTIFIPNILEIENYNFKKRNKLGPKFFWVRAFRELYNPTLAVKILSVLKNKYPEAILCMVGPEKDSSFQKVKELTQELNLTDSLEFTGVLSKENWHEKSIDYDIFINTTNFDNTPVSVMEAMALGLPVVSTNVGGMPYLIDDKFDGLLVEKDNVSEMVRCIEELIDNKYHNLALNARNKVELFDSKIVIKTWNSILQ